MIVVFVLENPLALARAGEISVYKVASSPDVAISTGAGVFRVRSATFSVSQTSGAEPHMKTTSPGIRAQESQG
jgi:hypothetical protein